MATPVDLQQVTSHARRTWANFVNGFGNKSAASRSPNVRSVMFHDRTERPVKFYVVEPLPLVSLISEKEAARFRQITSYTAKKDDYSVRGISRVDYTKQFLNNVAVILDGTLSENQQKVLGGKMFKVEAIAEGSSITWDLIISLQNFNR